MIEPSLLLDYGMAGLFIGYLIYDRQVIIKRLMKVLDRIDRKLK